MTEFMYDWQGKDVDLSKVVNVEVGTSSHGQFGDFYIVTATLDGGDAVHYQWRGGNEVQEEKVKAYRMRNELQKAVAQWELAND